jgi:glycosyltransferase involved in cell wall biosynthesis
MSINLSIVVPCFNEAANIPELLKAFDAVITSSDIELIVVNNGSTDTTSEVLEHSLQKYSFLSVVTVSVNKGYGFGIMSGLRSAKGYFLGWTHADLQTDPADVIKAFEIIKSQKNCENSYVKGDRKGRPLFDQFFTIGMSCLETIYMKQKLWDINAQPNVFHKSFFDLWENTAPDDFSLDLYVLYMAKRLGISVKRFNVVFPDRIHGESTWNTGLMSKWKFIKRTVEFSIELKKEL